MSAPLLRAAGLHKRFGTGAAATSAIVDVTFEVHAGELLAVTGPSGSGKTTLLHCASGIAVPDEGTVRFGDHVLTELDEAARANLRRDRMGFVFQRLNLLPALSALENVQLPLVLRGDARDAVLERSTALLALLGLEGRQDARPAQLSGGEAQRVAIARALTTEPDLVWADEPTGALDSVAAQEVVGQLRRIAEDGAAVVVVTHDAAVASRADRVLHLVDGRLAG